MATWKEKFNKKYNHPKGTSHSLSDISKETGVSKKGIQQIYNKGIGAYKTNPQSVRPNVSSKEQWAMARVYSSVMGGKASKVDAKELKMEMGGHTDKSEITRVVLTDFDKKSYFGQYKKVFDAFNKGSLGFSDGAYELDSSGQIDSDGNYILHVSEVLSGDVEERLSKIKGISFEEFYVDKELKMENGGGLEDFHKGYYERLSPSNFDVKQNGGQIQINMNKNGAVDIHEEAEALSGGFFKKGGETDFNPDGKIKDKIVHASGDAGGMLVGKRHSNGGIKALNKSTGQPLEMEGGEVVITRNAVSDNKKRSFNGKMMTNRQILSAINESGGGVSFADGGQVPNDVKFDCNAEYEYGGKTMCGKDLAYAMGGEITKAHRESLSEKLWNERGYERKYLSSLNSKELKSLYDTEFYYQTDYDDLDYATGGVTTAIVTDPNEAMADLQSTYGFGDVYAKGGSTNRARKGRIEESTKIDRTSDVQKVLDYIDKGFYLVENNTAIEHKEGGYMRVSKRVTNYFNNKMSKGGEIKKINAILEKIEDGQMFGLSRYHNARKLKDGSYNITTSPKNEDEGDLSKGIRRKEYKDYTKFKNAVIRILKSPTSRIDSKFAEGGEVKIPNVSFEDKDGKEFVFQGGKFAIFDLPNYRGAWKNGQGYTTRKNAKHNIVLIKLDNVKTDIDRVFLDEERISDNGFWFNTLREYPSVSQKYEGKLYTHDEGNINNFIEKHFGRFYAKGGTIECGSCSWSWDKKDGGDDMYVCHKCGTDNEKYFGTDNTFEEGGFVYNNTRGEIVEFLNKEYTFPIESGSGSNFVGITTNDDKLYIALGKRTKAQELSEDVTKQFFYPIIDKAITKVQIFNSNDDSLTSVYSLNELIKYFMDDLYKEGRYTFLFYNDTNDLWLTTDQVDGKKRKPTGRTSNYAFGKKDIANDLNNFLSKLERSTEEEKAVNLMPFILGESKQAEKYLKQEKINKEQEKKERKERQLLEANVFNYEKNFSLMNEISEKGTWKDLGFSEPFEQEKGLYYTSLKKDLNTFAELLPNFQGSKDVYKRKKIIKEMSKIQQKLMQIDINVNESLTKSNDLFTSEGLLNYYFTQTTQSPVTPLDKPCGLPTPNGGKSKLPMSAYLNVRTNQFKKWFGDWEVAYDTNNYNGCSLMIDEDTKEPKIYYHGVSKFRGGQRGASAMGSGVTRPYGAFTPTGFNASYFADNMEYAKFYSGTSDILPKQYRTKGFVYSIFLNIKNPIDLLPLGLKCSYKNIKDYLLVVYGLELEYNKTLLEKMKGDVNSKNNTWQYIRNDSLLIDRLKDFGYDAIFQIGDIPKYDKKGNVVGIIEDKEFLTFEPNQVKSVGVLNSFYGEMFNDIRFKKGGYVSI